MKAIICDFGVSKFKDMVASTQMGGSNAGTLAYQHKEQLEGKRVTNAVDVYAYAVIMGEVYSRKPAWSELNAREVRQAITDNKFPSFVGVPPVAEEIIAKCFTTPGERPCLSDIMSDIESLSDIDVW